ncbi:MAG: DciA family protein [Phycisphaerae bacterium]|jgi:hypothetical protein
MDEDVLLAKVNRTIKRSRPETVRFATLAGEFQRFIKKHAKPAKRNTTVPQAFADAVGEMMAQNCKIESLVRGTLKIKVAPGPYMFALQIQLADIIEKIQTQCPSSNIREIKLLCSK